MEGGVADGTVGHVPIDQGRLRQVEVDISPIALAGLVWRTAEVPGQDGLSGQAHVALLAFALTGTILVSFARITLRHCRHSHLLVTSRELRQCKASSPAFTLLGPVSAGLGRVEAVPAFADGRHDLGDPGVEGVEFFRLGRVGDERTSVT